MQSKIKLILVDDHLLVREGFKSLLTDMDFVELIGEAADGKQALQLLRNGLRPQIILMDVEMPVMGGLETTEIISKDYFGIKVIMLSIINNKDIIQNCIEKGAKGYLFKNASISELGDAIRKVADGGHYFSEEVTLTLLSKSTSFEDSALYQLSPREIEILKLVAGGYSSTEIGQQLFISPRTVDTHRNNIIQKLQVNGVAGLVRFAIKAKLV
ncbi:MAG: response regulator transcription factor [Saprospiraceae bacterium]|nr:response regulator transcription factor [Candidatus Defluviibacterium haderslevense]